MTATGIAAATIATLALAGCASATSSHTSPKPTQAAHVIKERPSNAADSATSIVAGATEKQLCRRVMDSIPSLTQAMSGVQTASVDTSALMVTILKEAQKPFSEIGALRADPSPVVAESRTLSAAMSVLEGVLTAQRWAVRDNNAISVLKAGAKLTQTCLPIVH